MASRKQIFKIKWTNIYLSCVYVESDKANPYRLYKHSITRHKEYGYPVEHKEQIAKYADLSSIMYYVYGYTMKKEYGSSVPGIDIP